MRELKNVSAKSIEKSMSRIIFHGLCWSTGEHIRANIPPWFIDVYIFTFTLVKVTIKKNHLCIFHLFQCTHTHACSCLFYSLFMLILIHIILERICMMWIHVKGKHPGYKNVIRNTDTYKSCFFIVPACI